MSDFNYTQTDPRERVVMLGNELLDLLYRAEESEALLKKFTALKDNQADIVEMMERPGETDAILSAITDGFKREALLRDYRMLRRTIEQLTTPRPEMPGADS